MNIALIILAVLAGLFVIIKITKTAFKILWLVILGVIVWIVVKCFFL